MVNTRTLEQLLQDGPGHDALRPAMQNRRAGAVAIGHSVGPLPADDGAVGTAWDMLAAAEPAAGLRGAARKRANTCRALAGNAEVQRGFAMLRTQILQATRTRGWHFIGIIAPRRGAGATVTTAGLGASLAHLKGTRSAVLDFDLAHPGLASAFEVRAPGPLSHWLSGQATMTSHLVTLGDELALGLAADDAEDCVTLLQPGAAVAALEQVRTGLGTDLVLCDLPPLLESEAALTVLPTLDAVLLVCDGHRNTADDLRRCEKLIEGRAALLGVVLNRSDDGGGT